MPGYPCCCGPPLIGDCAAVTAFLADKTTMEIAISSQLVSGGYGDCTNGDCTSAIDGTYFLTKGTTLSGSACGFLGGTTFGYTFSKNMDCVNGDNPHTGVAVNISCGFGTGGEPGVFIHLIYRKAPFGFSSCATAYLQFFPFPVNLNSGTVTPSSTPAFVNACVPTSSPMTFVIS